jgi:predicted outer membrane repeat protein
VVTIFGSDATLDAGQKGGFFKGDGSKGNTLLRLYGITLKRGKVSDSGGAIAVGGGANVKLVAGVEIYDSTFESNTGDYGGAISVSGVDVVLIIHNTKFVSNEAVGFYYGDFGGAIYINGYLKIYDSTFKSNTAATSYGGAIYVNQGTAEICDSTFESNQAYYGGAISDTSGANVEIHGSTFESNTANKGGAVYVYHEQLPSLGYSTLEIYNSTFDSNTASYGGAIDARFAVIVEIHDTTLISNIAGLSGGAIYINSGALSLHDSTFDTNIAEKLNGGAIYAHDGTVEIHNSTFTSSSAGTFGGAIGVNWTGNDVEIRSSSFISNEAGQVCSMISYIPKFPKDLFYPGENATSRVVPFMFIKAANLVTQKAVPKGAQR